MMCPFKNHMENTTGFVTLVAVLLVGVVGISIGLSILLLGLGSSRTSFAIEQSNQAKALANACAEEALEQMRDSTSFSGSGSFSLGQGICTYTVTNLGGQNRIVATFGIVGTMVRKVKVVIDKINPKIHVVSWLEAPDL